MDPVRREYVIITIAGMVAMLSGGMSFPIFPLYVKEEFVAPMLLIGMAVSGYFIIRMFAELPFGALSDRIGARKPLLIGRVIAILGALMTWAATDIYQLVIARALWGVGDASFFCISIAHVAKLFSAHQRGKALGTFQSIEMIGSFLGQSAGGFLVTLMGIKNIFLLNTGLGFVSLALVGLIKGHVDPSVSTSSTKELIPQRMTVRSVLNRTVVLACIMNFCVVFRNNGVISTVVPIYFTDELGIPYVQYGLLMAVSTVGGAIGTLFGGWVSDRMERRKVLAVGFALGTVATYVLSVADNFIFLLPVMALNGFFWGVIYSVTPALVADSVPPSMRGMAIGAYRTFFDFGGLMGPIVMGYIVQLVGEPQGYFMTFYVGTAIMLLNLPLTALLDRRGKVAEKPSP